MRAFVLTGHGGLDKLQFRDDWPTPQPSGRQVLIRVEACGLSNTDVNTRTAWYSKAVTDQTTGSGSDAADDEDATWGGAAITFPRIQGADVAGTVAAVGDAVDESLVGRRVLVDTWVRDWDDPDNLDKCGYFGSECDGGFAEFTVADARNVHPIESTFYLRDLTFTGATIVPPGVFGDLVGYIAGGEIEPLLAATYPLERLHEAQQAFIDKQHVGNIVVSVAGA